MAKRRRAVCTLQIAVLQAALGLGDDVFPELVVQTDKDRVAGEFQLVLSGPGLPASFETDSKAKMGTLRWIDGDDGPRATYELDAIPNR